MSRLNYPSHYNTFKNTIEISLSEQKPLIEFFYIVQCSLFQNLLPCRFILKSIHLIKVRIVMGNVSNIQQFDQNAEHSRRPPLWVYNTARKILVLVKMDDTLMLKHKNKLKAACNT